MAPRRPNAKRPLEVIENVPSVDLTQDDEETNPRPIKLPRLARRETLSSALPQTQEITDEDDNDELADVGALSQDYNSSQYSNWQLYGSLPTKIVGVRYYEGVATIGERIVLNREPQNPYDGNAIQVRNVEGAQIGHIPRQMASKLASYMDERALLVEGTITGRKGEFECPIELKLFGTSDELERPRLVDRMKADRLPLGDHREREKTEKERAKLAVKAAKEAAKMAKKNGGYVVANAGSHQWGAGSGDWAASSQGLGFGSQLEDIIAGSERFDPRNVGKAAERLGLSENDLSMMLKAEQPSSVATKLLPYQLQGLQWLLDKEQPKMPPQGSEDSVQLWKWSDTDPNSVINLAVNFQLRNTSPRLASGGILADDMGLGKTLQMISLIMADRELKRAPTTGSCAATLILAPLSVMSNWAQQIQRHLQPNRQLRVLTYHGARKEPVNQSTIDKYDVVITTYDTASSEYWTLKRGNSKRKPDLPAKNGLFSVQWRRVILDEGHNIRNPSAKRAVAAHELLAQSRWVLTGTPIVNTLKDLFSLVKFMRLSGGLDNYEIFNGAIMRPVNQGSAHGSYLLQTLMSSICLRRKKDMKFVDLRLPELSEYVHRINFSDQEKAVYEALEAEAKGTFEKYRQIQNSESGKKAQEVYRNLLEILLRLRQTCNHWKLCGEKRVSSLMTLLESQKTVELTKENREALQQMLQLSIDSQEDCPICIDNLKDPIITACAHVFCYTCIERVIETQHKCPMCRAELVDTNHLVRPAKDAIQPNFDVNTSSSKIEALLNILDACRKTEGNKTVVFSQWTSFLDVLQKQLDEHDYTYTRIDGTMSAVQRDAAMDALENNRRCTVMLASLGVGSVGLNLVAANSVILADSWWSGAIEDQAVDRVHRLGQKKETRVFRLVMEGSIEEKVLSIQSDKRKLMRLAFAEKESKKKDRGARLADIQRLLGEKSDSQGSSRGPSK